MSGDTITIDTQEVEIDDVELLGKLKEKAESIVIQKPVVEKKKKTYSENEEDEEEIVEDEDGNLVRLDEELLLDDEFDDTLSEVPDGYVVDEPKSPEETKEYWETEHIEEVKKEQPEEDWGF
jgi:hypothetical protein